MRPVAPRLAGTAWALAIAVNLLAVGCGGGSLSIAPETLSHGRFKDVRVYRPRVPIKHFALLLSGDGGWSSKLGTLATALTREGTLVAGIDTSSLFDNLERDGGRCVSPDGDLENLSHYIQAYYKLPTYFTPVLIGHSAGATLAYTTLAQAPKGLFAGAVTLSFCVDLDLHKPLCQIGGLRSIVRTDGEAGSHILPAPQLHAPWVALHGDEDEVCSLKEDRDFVAKTPGARFVELRKVDHNYSGLNWMPQFQAAYESVVGGQPPSVAPPPDLADLPITEVPAEGPAADSFAVLLSGDGGWAGLDKEVAGALAARGVPVAGVDSLRYFWTARTPETLARDIDRIIRYYAAHWKRKHALLVGYSQGADVLPFAVNRLPPATRSLVVRTALIGISHSASFEFHVTNWIGNGDDGLPTRPEAERLSPADTLCLYGDTDTDSICPLLNPSHARVVQLTGGHHFGGHYLPLAQLILDRSASSATCGAGPQSAGQGCVPRPP
ncbi:MAG TPA: AcvB/VirJ family lysyl-phosphatidylglycerol hydrolase [Steroidobacteraceae bacterium]|nr:AcvB/VirJ family lysyl-phosphatidylglycerol hydrolase [Steroidobacteraceae bacterium]